ncbi:MAG: phosphatase PAP2 family protein [Pseudomonadota bacterium]
MARIVSIIAWLVVAFVVGAASYLAQGPTVFDVEATRFLQTAPPGGVAAVGPIAEFVTALVWEPYLYGVLGVVAVLTLMLGGIRAVLAVPLAYWAAEATASLLRTLVFVPRPSADLVLVAGERASSGLPSTFGLIFGAVFGVLLWAGRRGGGAFGGVVRVLAIIVIAIGCSARIVLGGHWPSQMLASAALGVALAGVIVSLTALIPIGRGGR